MFGMTLRPHQQKVFEAFDKGIRDLILLWSRRAGKSLCAWLLIIRESILRPGVYWYCFNEYGTAKRNIWNASTKDGVKFLDMIPKSMVKTMNSNEMIIHLTNGSIIQLIGIKDANNLVGAEVAGIVFDEYARLNEESIDYITPALANSGGWQVIISTPRGRNHFYEKWMFAKAHPDLWFASNVHCGMPEIASYMAPGFLERRKAELMAKYGNNAMFEQEYMTNFESPNSGSVFGGLVKIMSDEGRITKLSKLEQKSYTAWDLGNADYTSILLFQINELGGINVLDHIEGSNEDAEYYVQEIRTRNWNVDTHFLPHDAAYRKGARNETYQQVLRQLGIKNTVVLNRPGRVADKLNFGRRLFSKSFIDESLERLIECLTKLSYEYNERTHTWSNKPTHNGGYSDTVDSFLYACQAVIKYEMTATKGLTMMKSAKTTASTKDKDDMLATLFAPQKNKKYFTKPSI